jgi:hypothetical protein
MHDRRWAKAAHSAQPLLFGREGVGQFMAMMM